MARPHNLDEAVATGLVQGQVDPYLREFLDSFYLAADGPARQAMLDVEPRITSQPRIDAYVAAVAEHLALRNGLEVPAWVLGADRFLREPFFPAGLESLKATTIMESPVAFRRRMIFVGEDPLYRPRRDARGIGAASVVASS